jgi:hypothetical protein
MISQWRRLAGALFFFSDAARRLSLAIARSAISLPGLLLLLTVATMALAAWGILWTDHHRRLDEQIRLGRAIAALTADWLDQAIAPAEAVARSEPARRLDRAALSPLLTDLVQTAPRVQAVNVTASRGEVIMASDALVTPRAGGRPVAAPRAADPATAPSSAVAALWYRAQVAGAAARLAAGRARPAPRPGAGWLARLLPELDLLVTLAAGREGTLTPAQARALVEQRLDQLLVAQAPVGLALIDWPAGRLLRANPAFAARLPLAAGQVVWEHLPGGPTGDVAASIRAAGQGGHPQSVRLAGVTDGERWRATPVAGTTQVGLIVLHVEG